MFFAVLFLFGIHHSLLEMHRLLNSSRTQISAIYMIPYKCFNLYVPWVIVADELKDQMWRFVSCSNAPYICLCLRNCLDGWTGWFFAFVFSYRVSRVIFLFIYQYMMLLLHNCTSLFSCSGSVAIYITSSYDLPIFVPIFRVHRDFCISTIPVSTCKV